jgi:hypothetical protein
VHPHSFSSEIVHGNSPEIAEIMVGEKHNRLIKPGSHILLIYKDLNSLREIYSQYARALLPENEIVVIGTQYETIGEVKNTLRFSGIDIERYLDDGTLLVIDAQKGYQDADYLGLWKLARSLLSRVKKEDRRGLSIFGDLGSFFGFERIEGLMEYEIGLPRKYEDGMKGVCCYHSSDFKRLNKIQQHALFDRHLKSVIAE